ncbi:hypothetical protein E2C01_078505 [Portunus trituberculatus]|uniref:Uncharacterized protein n=1 Tax=Portunus trituberculatus TaxID=210409 RepID=A0A5B7IP04_PORTR|nr:hypothetical protein [Portunus trituberculatus]
MVKIRPSNEGVKHDTNPLPHQNATTRYHTQSMASMANVWQTVISSHRITSHHKTQSSIFSASFPLPHPSLLQKH